MLQESSSSVTTMMSHQCLSIYGPDIAGAYGAILSEDDAEFLQQDYVYMPIVIVSTRDGDLKNCIINTTNTTVRVNFGLTLLGTKPARKWYIFPLEDLIEDPHGLSKPDILSPGYHILAAWVPNKGFAPKGEHDYLLTDYALVSDTSMSCPHAAGIAALLKASHHAWSSASIQSALMKTADVTGNAVRRIIEMTTEVAGTPLDFGAGHVNPNKAMDLDLVSSGYGSSSPTNTLTFSGNDSKAVFNMTMEINLEAATVTQQIDYFGNSGFLSWCEVNGRRD
ncbi:hypothetical protein D5086_008866 [Populus alba]|uniref:Uncharacterized protein n=1 Tax=Populus alba TaxID=43335 RepID=A0ACC4CH06_POPAL